MKSGVLPASKAGLSAPPPWPGTRCSGLQAPGRAVRARHPCCDSGGADRNLQWLGPCQGLMCGNFLLDPVPLRSLLFSPSALVGLFYPSEKGPSIFFRLFLSCPASPATGSDPQRRKGCPSPRSGKAGPLPRAVVITTLLAPRAVGAGGPGPVETPDPVQWQCHARYGHCTVGL